MSDQVIGTILILAGGLFGLFMLALMVTSLVWIYRDAEEHDGTGCLWAILIFLCWPIGLLLYALIRQKTSEPGP